MNKEDVFSAIKKKNYHIVEGFVSSELLNLARKEYFDLMKGSILHSQGEKFDPGWLIAAPWRKQSIGSRTGNGEPYSQVLQTTYLLHADDSFPALAEIFEKMISLRNSWTGMRADYGNDLTKDSFWNACRVHHYPQGGGHMAGHRDTLFPALLKEFEIPFLQMLVILSNRGTDFDSGGGYVVDNSGDKIFVESDDNAGSIVFFDGSTIHGVDDIDPDILLDFSSEKGRISLLVNLYSNQNLS